MRCAATYPIINQVFKRLTSMIPSMSEKRKAHFAFTKLKTESRLDRDTDRKDFTTYVSFVSYWSYVILISSAVYRSNVIMTNEA